MLDQDTKRHIDSARDILVGKIPDPKAQVEQITTALIYKFMDDMDRENLALGLNAQFFVGEWEKYAWSKLMSKKNSGQERMNLYVEGIASFPKNEHLPQLFRDIFKDAFLPFRDPRTLNLFLKEIDWFSYEHSENLGNAFEYLLSVLGSQGDAGQFRTPRHIIDFIVAVVNPQKEDRILDPACGTAGFLISAYKHILANTQEEGLTPEEKVRLVNNVVGYDISPDMVKLALVNLYLHSFPKPQIFEYDTLTSEERWDDVFDVILANPPFMTPKGGIDPHKKFQVQARRAEVLFVDYIAEHLKLNGRAGIIVPEGIIFQSSNAYKELRKTLIQNYGLYAVVSLPAGVFNPYSGVKTSILLLDRKLAKLTDDFLFVKIENDGFDLGAQRREVEGDQLPTALNMIQAFQKHVMEKTDFDVEAFDLGHVVMKGKIVESGDFNLSSERYKVDVNLNNSDWPMVEIGEVAKIINGRAYKKNELLEQGKYRVLRVGNFFSNQSWYYSNLELNEDKYCQSGDLLYAWSASFGPKIWNEEKVVYHYHIWKIVTSNRIYKKFLYYLLQEETDKIKKESGRGITMIHITKSGMEAKKIPLPPLHVQEEIVAELDGYQKIVDGARQVVENYRPTFEIDPEWEMVELGEVATLLTGGTPKRSVLKNYENGNIPWLVSGDIHKGIIYECEGRISKIGYETSNAKYLPINSVLIALNGQGKTRGTVALLKMKKATCNQSLVSINPNNDKLLSEFLYFQLKMMYQFIRNLTGDLQRSGLNMPIIRKIKIYIPNIELQKNIVSKLKKEQSIVNANKELIEIFEKKIEDRVNSIWGK